MARCFAAKVSGSGSGSGKKRKDYYKEDEDGEEGGV